MDYIYKNISLEMVFQNIFIFRLHPTAFMHFAIGILTDTGAVYIDFTVLQNSFSIVRYRKDNATMNICKTIVRKKMSLLILVEDLNTVSRAINDRYKRLRNL